MSVHKTMAGLAGLAVVVGLGTAVAQAPKERPTSKSQLSPSAKRGEYLVTIAGCNDCHTPFKLGKAGPEPDMARMLSGHPESMRMPPPPKLEAPWGMAGAVTNTAWHGPWGTSFTANLTPDKETGLGAWTEQEFIDALRSGRHRGRGRPILPPMPWQMVGKMTDEDLKAVFAYFQSVPPIRNRVPEPIPPPGTGGSGPAGEKPQK
jgi:cytochrome c553